MGWRVLKCPACGGDLNVETDRNIIFCQHCGVKLIKDSDHVVIEHVERTIDEARIREIDFEEAKYNAEHKSSKRFFLYPNAAGLVLLILGLMLNSVGVRELYCGLIILLSILSFLIGNAIAFIAWSDRNR